MYRVFTGKRPRIDFSQMPAAYARLLMDCWAAQPASRPTYRSILQRLRRMHASQGEAVPLAPHEMPLQGWPSSSDGLDRWATCGLHRQSAPTIRAHILAYPATGSACVSSAHVLPPCGRSLETAHVLLFKTPPPQDSRPVAIPPHTCVSA